VSESGFISEQGKKVIYGRKEDQGGDVIMPQQMPLMQDVFLSLKLYQMTQMSLSYYSIST